MLPAHRHVLLGVWTSALLVVGIGAAAAGVDSEPSYALDVRAMDGDRTDGAPDWPEILDADPGAPLAEEVPTTVTTPVEGEMAPGTTLPSDPPLTTLPPPAAVPPTTAPRMPATVVDLSGRVLDARGAALDGVCVLVMPDVRGFDWQGRHWGEVPTAVTGQDGQYRLELGGFPAALDATVDVRAWDCRGRPGGDWHDRPDARYGAIEGPRFSVPLGVPTRHDVELPDFAEITLTVVDSDGRAVAGTCVTAAGFFNGDTAETDGNGIAVLTRVDPHGAVDLMGVGEGCAGFYEPSWVRQGLGLRPGRQAITVTLSDDDRARGIDGR